MRQRQRCRIYVMRCSEGAKVVESKTMQFGRRTKHAINVTRERISVTAGELAVILIAGDADFVE